ncbi:FecR family protein [Negadavirga shengliensis]|uniref:FecR family protein n=1 Tax=Negadavirga shengliensis TaxID=1389218 RepID=A0ABV9T3F6_9BACT
MKREFNHIEDFLQDPSFRRWILDSDSGKNLFWEHWRKENPEKKAILDEAALLLEAMASKSQVPDEEEKADVFRRINTKITTFENRKRHKKQWFAIAAGFVLIAAVAFSVHYFTGLFEQPNDPSPLATSVMTEKQSEKGQKTKFILPDGSTVYLNSASRIVYDGDYSTTNRNIFLEGEAYFEVAPDSLLPFRVTSANVMVEALGTSFNINAYDDQFKVQLTSGKIKVQNDQDQVLLEPGLETTLTQNRSFAVKAYDLSKAALWKNGIMLFERTPLDECFRQLERWYNVEIETSGEMPSNAVVSGKFDNDYLVNVMESIAYSLDLKFTLDGKKVTVYLDK